jgi:disulfide bond formation protein DsbB
MGGNLDALRAEIMAAPVTRCDEATWFFLGLSMAGWNILYSGALGLLGLVLARKK